MKEKMAFYAVKRAVEQSRPELVESIQGRKEIERIALDISAAIKEAGLRLVHAGEKEISRQKQQ